MTGNGRLLDCVTIMFSQTFELIWLGRDQGNYIDELCSITTTHLLTLVALKDRPIRISLLNLGLSSSYFWLVASDFFLFPKLKEHFKKTGFTRTDEAKNEEVAHREFFTCGLKWWKRRTQKCTDPDGSYTEKNKCRTFCYFIFTNFLNDRRRITIERDNLQKTRGLKTEALFFWYTLQLFHCNIDPYKRSIRAISGLTPQKWNKTWSLC